MAPVGPAPKRARRPQPTSDEQDDEADDEQRAAPLVGLDQFEHEIPG